jgi:uncharacterized membrane protein
MASDAAVALKHPISKELHEERTLGERLADSAAQQIGSWRFLIIQSILVSLWIVLNGVALAKGWDPYPFVLLNLLFSVQAAYTGPVLLLSSNRAAQRDRIVAEHDYVTNDKSEKLIEGVMSELLRNSVATLAIAQHLEVKVEPVESHQALLDEKVDDMQRQLGEAEDALKEVEDEMERRK